MSEAAGADEDRALHLARVLRAAVSERTDRGAPWLAEHAVDPDTGQPVMGKQAAHELLTFPRKSWISASNMRAIASLFGWQHAAVYSANAQALGLDPPRAGTLSLMLPAAADQLPDSDRDAIVAIVRQLCRARGLTD